MLQLKQGSRRVDLSVNNSTISLEVSKNTSRVYVHVHVIAVICIQGQHITNVDKEEITVMVGRDQCVVEAIADTSVIICYAPQRDEPAMENVTVRT